MTKFSISTYQDSGDTRPLEEYNDASTPRTYLVYFQAVFSTWEFDLGFFNEKIDADWGPNRYCQFVSIDNTKSVSIRESHISRQRPFGNLHSGKCVHADARRARRR